jgi:hypothetical protein
MNRIVIVFSILLAIAVGGVIVLLATAGGRSQPISLGTTTATDTTGTITAAAGGTTATASTSVATGTTTCSSGESPYGSTGCAPSCLTTDTGCGSATTTAPTATSTAPQEGIGELAAVPGETKCDPNIYAGKHTTCPFAENVFRAVAHQYGADEEFPSTVTASSPVTGKSYSLTCSSGGGVVSCETANDAGVAFSEQSVLLYEGDG